jgi:hypothetical protein
MLLRDILNQSVGKQGIYTITGECTNASGWGENNVRIMDST